MIESRKSLQCERKEKAMKSKKDGKGDRYGQREDYIKVSVMLDPDNVRHLFDERQTRKLAKRKDATISCLVREAVRHQYNANQDTGEAMKPAKFQKVKAARLKEGDKVVMMHEDGLISSSHVLRVVKPKMKAEPGQKQRPGHLMTITTGAKRFRVLPSTDLFIHERERQGRQGRR